MSFLLYLVLLLVVGMIAQWLAVRFKTPSILLLLIFGYALAQITGHKIDNYLADQGTLLGLISYFVAIILFEGGMSLKFRELREAGSPAGRLCSVAVVVAGGLITFAGMWILGYPLPISALLGAILIVTGPTVISPLLNVVNPTRKIASIVKWEGIVVDPIGAILAVLVFQTALFGGLDKGWHEGLWLLGKMLLIGGLMAWILARIIAEMMLRHWIPDFLESLFFLTVVGAAFAGSNLLQPESGLLTVTVMGIALSNHRQVSVRHIIEFKEHLRVLIISLLFLMLAGRIELASLRAVWGRGLLFLLALIFIVRPASVFLANAFSRKTTLRERLFLAFLAPRGIVAAAVTSIFALEIKRAAGEGSLPESFAAYATELVPLVFIVIIGTVAFYGLLAAPLARRLGLAKRHPDGVVFAGGSAWVRLIAKALHDDGHDVMLLDSRFENVSAAKLQGLRAERANILSDYVDEMDFTGLGHFIACTPNDEVNALASREFTHHFDKAKVWQIRTQTASDYRAKALSSRIQGRACFSQAPTFPQLDALAREGAAVKKIQLTELFTLADFRKMYGEAAVILFLSDPEQGLRPMPAEYSNKISNGTTLYALIPA